MLTKMERKFIFFLVLNFSMRYEVLNSIKSGLSLIDSTNFFFWVKNQDNSTKSSNEGNNVVKLFLYILGVRQVYFYFFFFGKIKHWRHEIIIIFFLGSNVFIIGKLEFKRNSLHILLLTCHILSVWMNRESLWQMDLSQF